MLLALLDYIKKGQCVSIEQLSREFHIEEQALLPMLEKWVEKGVLKPFQRALKCAQKCTSCRTNQLIFYEYTQETSKC